MTCPRRPILLAPHRPGGACRREGVAITLANRANRGCCASLSCRPRQDRAGQVPTIADLRARRLEMTRAALREAILAGGLDHYRVAVESLAQEHDLMDIALAAVKLAHQASGGDTDQEPEGSPAKPATADANRAGRPRDPNIPCPASMSVAGRLVGCPPAEPGGEPSPAGGIKGNLLGRPIEICGQIFPGRTSRRMIDEVVRAMKNRLIKGKRAVVRRFVEK